MKFPLNWKWNRKILNEILNVLLSNFMNCLDFFALKKTLIKFSTDFIKINMSPFALKLNIDNFHMTKREIIWDLHNSVSSKLFNMYLVKIW